MHHQRSANQQMTFHGGLLPTATVQRDRAVVSKEEEFVRFQLMRLIDRVLASFREVMHIPKQTQRPNGKGIAR